MSFVSYNTHRRFMNSREFKNENEKLNNEQNTFREIKKIRHTM